MKKSIFTIVLILLFTSIVPATSSETLRKSSKREMTHVVLAVMKKAMSVKYVKKRKLKKAVRKTARIYREIKPDRENKKKSRKVQRRVNRLINLF